MWRKPLQSVPPLLLLPLQSVLPLALPLMLLLKSELAEMVLHPLPSERVAVMPVPHRLLQASQHQPLLQAEVEAPCHPRRTDR